ncbi:MAG: major capsid protein [Chaetfec virus UA24_2268]|nr:MAG: major capsid protein [Chaetfec virus UA24_2268]
MANFDRYNQLSDINARAEFTEGVSGEIERSVVTPSCEVLTSFNGGDIVPILCSEVLPGETISCDLDFVVRQTTLLTPTMGRLNIDLYAFFVPNRVVNESTPYVFGENPNGSWTATEVTYAPLEERVNGTVLIPVQSVADYYGFPTQKQIPNSILAQCHDLKFRGYIAIYNEYFRDQNYQPPVPFSKLNVFQGFMRPKEELIDLYPNGGNGTEVRVNDTRPDGTVGIGALQLAGYGNNRLDGDALVTMWSLPSVFTGFSALDPPLKANKMHDYFTSVLPAPQKGPRVLIPVSLQGNSDLNSIRTGNNFVDVFAYGNAVSIPNSHLKILNDKGGISGAGGSYQLSAAAFYETPWVSSLRSSNLANTSVSPPVSYPTGSANFDNPETVAPSNLVFNADDLGGSNISVDDLRLAAATQQVYELLARCGSRYREYVRSFFGIDIDNPFKDIPEYLGHIRRNLDVFQTAQTSASEGASTPQGNLAAFGYTSSGGELFKPYTAYEHGYLHVFAVVRHRNIYSSYLARDNFRLSAMDYYQYPLANISEQPVWLREIQPFTENANSQPIGYQEAWAEYRYEPDRVTGYMRPGIAESLAIWNYADDGYENFSVVNGKWLQSNTKEVVDRTVRTTSEAAPQFRGQFLFKFRKELPMPTYSVPGLDII